MGNEYREEFDQIMTVDDFKKWLDKNMGVFVLFVAGMSELKVLKKWSGASLRWWIETFLLWCEYEDNKTEVEELR